jgi:exodeoxyribonuclease-5
VKWSPQQDAALGAVSRWLKSPTGDKPFFYLAGYAGTGKTTLAKHFAEDVGHVLFGSFTGKAASVMRDKGCGDATTIHRLIYESRSKSAERLRELKAQLDEAKTVQHQAALRIQIQQEVIKLKQPYFQLNENSAVQDADLIIIDECSMVNAEMGEDLLSFKTPVLVLGDPAQLPPVFGAGYFTGGEPDIMLTEVHRQARESGILRLATDIREGKPLEYCDLHDATVLRKGELNPDNVPTYDQIIVGRNKTRHATNRRMRELLGRESQFPEHGDRLVCLRNNHDLGLLNGEIYTAVDDGQELACGSESFEIEIDGPSGRQLVTVYAAPFLGEKLEHYDRTGETQEFDYGYVLTCHKAQGSQWPTVIVFDESSCFRQNARAWLYTAATRASEYLAIIR